MAIGTSIEEALIKAVSSLELGSELQVNLISPSDTHNPMDQLLNEISRPTDDRLFKILTALGRGASIDSIHNATKVDKFFLAKLAHVIVLQKELSSGLLTSQLVERARKAGFTNSMIQTQHQATDKEIAKLDSMANQHKVYKMVDTCAAEFDSATPYFYSTVGTENESQPLGNSILVIGSGPIRIGQGVEFDYATVHCIKAIQAAGYKAIIINNNPETVSTDFSISDKLYFEPLTIDHVMDVINLEKPLGVIVEFGGQTAINLTEKLTQRGVKILGTSIYGINQTENRHGFEELLLNQDIAHPDGMTAMSLVEAHKIADQIGYPVLVRPSFVLGGRGMAIVNDESELNDYLKPAIKASHGNPILIDKYIHGIECEVDILSDGKSVLVPGIMEHLEGSGVHSGDSIAVYPPQHLTDDQKQQIVEIATKIGLSVHAIGMMNIQFIVADQVYVIEVNPRASRTVPFMSKVTKMHLAQFATQLILGKTLAELDLTPGLYPESNRIFVKAPVFSFAKLTGAPTTLNPEMKSTGENIGSGDNFLEAYHKALLDSYHYNYHNQSQYVVISETDYNNSETVAELKNNGFTVIKYSSEFDWSIAPAFSLVTADNLNGKILANAALSHQIPLFTSFDTIKPLVNQSVSVNIY
ncbi:carbamoyl-phosphate synthase large chain [Lentilactobacillus kosonis]|uniref:Carbamoyl phosphate synthase pyrimidine-specific large chain n=1 Tax=Lentilactobacillus kosonis TaxID=2810561 RepID=A0A401FIZ5_9LACO|nr:carbamoyl-phosphate synthase large chain [Lentilactobacillus kosonis]